MKNVMKAVAALMLMTVVVFVATGFKKNDESISGATGGGPSSFVDLGLPSGTLWAKWNVGASSPQEVGDKFTWGETKKPKSGKSTEYTRDGQVLQSEDDAATDNWGKNWRMPTKEEWQEMRNYCSREWTTEYGVNGCRVTGPNGNSIFLPHASYWTATYGGNQYGASAYCGEVFYRPGGRGSFPNAETWATYLHNAVRPVLKYTKDEYLMKSIEGQLDK